MELKTKRLILREWRAGDESDLVEGLNNIKVAKWLAMAPYPYTRRDARYWIDHCTGIAKAGRRKGRDEYNFAICTKSDGKAIGGMSLDKINATNKTCNLGYWLNERYHRMGYGTEAMDAVLGFAFRKLKFRRIESAFFKGNPSSFKLQEKFGFRIEGIKVKGMKCNADGKIKDEHITALLRNNWKRVGYQTRNN